MPKRPVIGIDEALLEGVENGLKSLLAHIHPRITYYLLDVEVDARKVLVVAVEPGADGPYETSDKAEKDKDRSEAMARRKRTDNAAEIGFEQQIWSAADKLRGNMDASELQPRHQVPEGKGPM